MLDAAVSDIRGRGVKAIALPCDLRDEAQVKDATAKALEFFGGRVDVIVNNAGVAALDTIQDMRSDVLDAVIDTVVKGHMYVVKYLAPNMIERQSGKIINITSGVTGAGTSICRTTWPPSTRSTVSSPRGRSSWVSSTST